jgi:phosphate transport system permease protein
MPPPSFSSDSIADRDVLLSYSGGEYWQTWGDQVLVWTLRLCAGVAVLVIVFIVTYLGVQSFPLLSQYGTTRFFTVLTWTPTRAQFNLSPMLVGTLCATLGTILLAAPLGIATAIFARFYAPTAIIEIVHGVLGLLAGIPSVVYGLVARTSHASRHA